MFRVLIADSLPEQAFEPFNQLEEIAVDNKSGISVEELKQILPEYDGLVVRSRTKVTADVLASATRLQVIGRAGAGVDNIDVAEATRRGIVVMNTPGGNTIAATEHTIALLMSLLRNIPAANASIREGQWNRKPYLGHELFSKTIGIVGLGKIGREVAKRLGAFGTQLIGYDPIITKESASRIGIELVSFDRLLKQADIITVHVPRMPETINMINAENLKTCRDGVVIVNCARGGIINEQALIGALDSGKVSAAAVDVFENEPPENYDLAMHEKVLATPHLGASTEEAQAKVAEQILHQMLEYFRKNIAVNAINFISVDEKIQPIIAPYFKLADRLGLLFSQVRKGRLTEIAIRFYGDIINLPSEPIASHLLAGALRSKPDANEAPNVDFINMVNALAIAREKGIDIEMSRKDHPLTSRTNLIACDFHTDEGTLHLAGTVYAQDIYRLVQFNKYDVDADLGDKMIFIENDDVPGIIGKVGTILGENRINISHVSSGRVKSEKTAVNIFNVEGELDDSLRKKLISLKQVHTVLLTNLDE